MHFLAKKYVWYFDSSFTEMWFQRSKWQWLPISLTCICIIRPLCFMFLSSCYFFIIFKSVCFGFNNFHNSPFRIWNLKSKDYTFLKMFNHFCIVTNVVIFMFLFFCILLSAQISFGTKLYLSIQIINIHPGKSINDSWQTYRMNLTPVCGMLDIVHGSH